MFGLDACPCRRAATSSSWSSWGAPALLLANIVYAQRACEFTRMETHPEPVFWCFETCVLKCVSLPPHAPHRPCTPQHDYSASIIDKAGANVRTIHVHQSKDTISTMLPSLLPRRLQIELHRLGLLWKPVIRSKRTIDFSNPCQCTRINLDLSFSGNTPISRNVTTE